MLVCAASPERAEARPGRWTGCPVVPVVGGRWAARTLGARQATHDPRTRRSLRVVAASTGRCRSCGRTKVLLPDWLRTFGVHVERRRRRVYLRLDANSTPIVPDATPAGDAHETMARAARAVRLRLGAAAVGPWPLINAWTAGQFLCPAGRSSPESRGVFGGYRDRRGRAEAGPALVVAYQARTGWEAASDGGEWVLLRCRDSDAPHLREPDRPWTW